MEAPEKIYLIRNFPRTTSLNTTDDYHGKYLQEWYTSREKDADIEYIRTDAFIEKTCKWIETNMDDYIHVEYDTMTGKPTNEAHIAHKKVVEDFKNYIKGE